MAQIGYLTEVVAINEIISTVGQSPINSLNGTLPVDVHVAKNKLDISVRRIQQPGWNFNLEYDFPLIRNSDDEISIPGNVYTLDVNREFCFDRDPVIRGRKLYDRKNHTYKFTKNLEAEIIFILPFEELPPAGKDYAYRLAGRSFQDSQMASQLLDAFTDRELRDAKHNFLRAHRNVKDNNFLGHRSKFMPGDVYP